MARKKISVPSGGSDRTRSFRIRCLEERRLKIRMFRWLSRKGGVQAGYTRVIDLRHPKMLGSNRASMNSPFFFLLTIVITVPTAYRGNRSPRPRALSLRRVSSAGSFRSCPRFLLRSASVSNFRYLVSNFQRGYARVKTVRPIRVRYETSDRDHGRVRNVRDF